MKRDDSERELRELHTKTDREMGKAKQVRSCQPINSYKCVRLIRPSFVCLFEQSVFENALPLIQLHFKMF